MKLFALVGLLVFAQASFGFTESVSVQCALNEPSELSATVPAGRKVTVLAPQYVNGYQWISREGIAGKIVKPADTGGTYLTAFVIDTRKQTESSKSYLFRSQRSFDPSAPTWDCTVTVKLK